MVHFYPELKVGYSRLVAISTDNLLKPTSFEMERVLNGRSCRTLSASFSVIWTSRNTRTRQTIR
jgi:hypothetical protein